VNSCQRTHQVGKNNDLQERVGVGDGLGGLDVKDELVTCAAVTVLCVDASLEGHHDEIGRELVQHGRLVLVLEDSVLERGRLGRDATRREVRLGVRERLEMGLDEYPMPVAGADEVLDGRAGRRLDVVDVLFHVALELRRVENGEGILGRDVDEHSEKKNT